MSKKILAMMIAVVMVIGMLPMSVFATDPVAKIGDTTYTDIRDAFKELGSGETLELLKSITIDYKWDVRPHATNSSYATIDEPAIIDGKGFTMTFTGQIDDAGNNHCALRITANATVKNLTIDLSSATPSNGKRLRAISSGANDLTVTNCKFIGRSDCTSRAIIYGEKAGTSHFDADISITGCTFTNWAIGLTDNENGKDASNVSVSGNTFTNARAQLSASESMTFSNNTMDNSWVSITTYKSDSELVVVATGNTLEEDGSADNQKNIIHKGASFNVQEEFGLGGSLADGFAAEVDGMQYPTLQAAFDAVENKGTVKILPGTHIVDTTNVNGLAITANGVTVEGVKDASGNNPVIKFTYLNGLHGGINYNGSDMTFKNIDFVVDAECAWGSDGWSKNVLGYYYENVSSYPRTGLVVDSCNFTNLSNGGVEGLIAIMANQGDFTVINSTFTGFNTGMFCETYLNLETVTVDNNKFTNVDSPMYLAWYGENITTEKTINFTDNTVNGAFEATAPVVTITDGAQIYDFENILGFNVINVSGNTGVDILISDPAKETDIIGYDEAGVKIKFSSEALAEENAQIGIPYYLNYGTSAQKMYIKTASGEIVSAITVSFINADTAPISVIVGEKAVAPEAPTRYRYLFDGWYTDAACTNKFDFNTLLYADLTLYAKWVDDTELNNRLMINALTTSLFRNFSVRATANEGGTLTNEGLVFTMFNNRLTYKATPNEGYEVVSFIVDGVDLGPITEYKFDRITANHTVEVVFAPIADDAE